MSVLERPAKRAALRVLARLGLAATTGAPRATARPFFPIFGARFRLHARRRAIADVAPTAGVGPVSGSSA